MAYLKDHGTRVTPQREPIPGSTQVANSAGGYSFAVDDFTRLERWLVLGSEGGSYYAAERKLTAENLDALGRCLTADPQRTVELIVQVSREGRALRNDEAVFALACAAGHSDVATRQLALGALSQVCRIPTHLFMFVDFVGQFRGWGRSLRRAVALDYARKPTDMLAYHLVKYRERHGWSHRDLLRLAHPGAKVSSGNPVVELDPEHEALLRWAAGKDTHEPVLPDAIIAFERAQASTSPKQTAALVRQFNGALPREALRTEHLTDVDVNAALLDVGMPMTALLRNLANLTRYGVLKPLGERTGAVCRQLTNEDALAKARVHPLAILFALATYREGRGLHGRNTWEPVPEIVAALDQAFYGAFRAVEPAGKRFLLGLDVSGSMNGEIHGSALTCMEAAAAMAMVSHRTEPRTHVFAFDDGMRPVTITPEQRLDDVLGSLPRNWGGTDCALPMLYALDRELEVDTFIVYTDSETWFGDIHPVQALRRYRERTQIPAKLVVVGMVSNGFTIADPDDAGMLDVVGMDPSVPAVISDFARA